MVASEQTDVIFVSIAKFYYFFTDSELKKMQNHVVEIDRADVQGKVIGNFRAKSQYQSSMLNAMDLNQVASYESFDQRRYLTFN